MAKLTDNSPQVLAAVDAAMRPKKGDKKIDLRALVDYCREHNIPRGENGYPEEIVEKFVIGVYEYGRED